MFTKKVKKVKKTMGTSYKVTRERSDKELLNEDKRKCFIVEDTDSTLIEGTINILNFRARGMGMVFRMWVHERAPLNLQWPVLKNGGANFHHCWFVDSM